MAVSCGLNCTFVVGEEGQVLVSGRGEHGQLGLGDTQDRLRMTRLAGDFTVRVVMVSAGGGHSALLDSDGELWMSGRGDRGQLGTGEREDVLGQPSKARHVDTVRAVASTHRKFVQEGHG